MDKKILMLKNMASSLIVSDGLTMEQWASSDVHSQNNWLCGVIMPLQAVLREKGVSLEDLALSHMRALVKEIHNDIHAGGVTPLADAISAVRKRLAENN